MENIGECAITVFLSAMCGFFVYAVFRYLNDALDFTLVSQLSMDVTGPASVFVVSLWRWKRYFKKRRSKGCRES